jgi:hypothetical protein
VPRAPGGLSQGCCVKARNAQASNSGLLVFPQSGSVHLLPSLRRGLCRCYLRGDRYSRNPTPKKENQNELHYSVCDPAKRRRGAAPSSERKANTAKAFIPRCISLSLCQSIMLVSINSASYLGTNFTYSSAIAHIGRNHLFCGLADSYASYLPVLRSV